MRVENTFHFAGVAMDRRDVGITAVLLIRARCKQHSRAVGDYRGVECYTAFSPEAEFTDGRQRIAREFSFNAEERLDGAPPARRRFDVGFSSLASTSDVV